jgi:hypothetical protein
MFKYKTCGVKFPETKGTVFYYRHLKEENILEKKLRTSKKYDLVILDLPDLNNDLRTTFYSLEL